ncbi:MAG: ribonuclease HI [Myxococcales bacterium]|nr:ribonuclease HI [Myxococcales bacterium]
MPWKRYRLRDADVWAEVDATGALLADSEGRVAIVYKKEPAAKVYRASGKNLGAVAGAPIEADLGGGAGGGGGGGGSGASAPARARAPARAASRGPGALGQPAPADAVHVWTDGACTGNPGPAGLGVVVLDGPGRREHSEYLGHGTNNIAELTAVLRGLDLVADRDRPVLVYTDSSYTIGVLSMGWKAKANVELVAEIRDALARFADVRFVKVPGHAGVPENERCDELARDAIVRRR